MYVSIVALTHIHDIIQIEFFEQGVVMENVINNWQILTTSAKQLVRRVGALLTLVIVNTVVWTSAVGIGAMLAAIFDTQAIARIVGELQFPGAMTLAHTIMWSFSYINVGIIALLICVLLAAIMFMQSSFFVVVRAIAREEPVITASNVVLTMHYCIPIFVGSLLFILGATFGFIFLVAPGLYIISSWWLFGPIILDEHVGPIEAFRRSYYLMQGHRLQFLGLLLIIIGINFITSYTGLVFNEVVGGIVQYLVGCFMHFIGPLCAFHYYYALRDKAE